MFQKIKSFSGTIYDYKRTTDDKCYLAFVLMVAFTYMPTQKRIHEIMPLELYVYVILIIYLCYREWLKQNKFNNNEEIEMCENLIIT